jgi:hypothetical protein
MTMDSDCKKMFAKNLKLTDIKCSQGGFSVPTSKYVMAWAGPDCSLTSRKGSPYLHWHDKNCDWTKTISNTKRINFTNFRTTFRTTFIHHLIPECACIYPLWDSLFWLSLFLYFGLPPSSPIYNFGKYRQRKSLNETHMKPKNN